MTISFPQIRALRAEALAANDYDMAAICDLASVPRRSTKPPRMSRSLAGSFSAKSTRL